MKQNQSESSFFQHADHLSAEKHSAALQTLVELAREKTGSKAFEQADLQNNKELVQYLLRRKHLQELRKELPLNKPWPLFALTCICVITLAVLFSWPGQRLDFTADGAAIQVGSPIVPREGRNSLVQFRDGTTISFESGAKGHIAEVDAHGARIVLEKGSAELSVIHRPAAKWAVIAGPFEIRVTGTAFLVTWSADDEILDVQMHDGTVEIRGPLSPEALLLKGGQHLQANMQKKQMLVSEQATESPPKSSASSGEVKPEAAHLTIPRANALTPKAYPELSWSQRVGMGDFKGVLNDALEGGIENTLNYSTGADLDALGSAASYAGRTDIAKKVWESLRRRFPGSGPACKAAFLLGRMASDVEHNPGAAITYFDQHLRECSGSGFNEEALRRKMLLLEKTSGAAAAGQVAREYLQRFPKGPLTAKARELAEQSIP